MKPGFEFLDITVQKRSKFHVKLRKLGWDLNGARPLGRTAHVDPTPLQSVVKL